MSGVKYGAKMYPFMQYMNIKYGNRVLNTAPTQSKHEKDWNLQIW